jgi:hypothetical protein
MMLSSIKNKIAFCEYETRVFHLNVLQILNYRTSKCVRRLCATLLILFIYFGV